MCTVKINQIVMGRGCKYLTVIISETSFIRGPQRHPKKTLK